MQILAFAKVGSGPDYHRIIMPLMLMKEPNVVIKDVITEADFAKGIDLFMYSRELPEEKMETFRELKKKYGFKVCIDIDDYWALDEHHILYQHYLDTDFAARQIAAIKEADIVLTTNERLADKIKQVSPFTNVHICPNAIPKAYQFDIKPEPHHLTRLFWQGSATHLADIQILKRPLEELRSIAPKIKMIMAGFEEDQAAWEVMARDYTSDFQHQYKIIPGLGVKEYYEHYRNADICLVPLVNSRFNGFKSNLKVLEAANLRLPVIASAVNPYLGMPLLYCKKGTDWVRHITRLVNSKNRAEDAGEVLAEYCQKHFDFYKINKERYQILNHAISTPTR